MHVSNILLSQSSRCSVQHTPLHADGLSAVPSGCLASQ